MATISEPGYSATVEAALHIGDQVLSLAKVGRNTCVLRQPIQLPTRHGEIVVHIDGHVHRTPVELLEPLTPDTRHVAYRRVAE